MKVIVQTLGCRLNQIESESIGKFFADKKIPVSFSAVAASSAVCADVAVCVLNTCAVTQKSEQKARRAIRLLLEKFPNACVVVTGCYAQLSRDVLLQIDNRVAVLPGQKKSRIGKVAELIENCDYEKYEASIFAKKIQHEIFDLPQETRFLAEQTFKLVTDSFVAHSRASLKIQDGCNGICSYCAIKNARGKSVSLDATDVISRVQALEKSGHREIVLTGVNVAQYKSEYDSCKVDFTALLSLILKNTHDVSFRLSSIWPTVVDDRFCEVISDKRVMPHFHLSVQSGSDRILLAMRRQYSRSDVVTAIEKLRRAKNMPFVACDIIAGFPGETESDFSDTLFLVKDCGFAWIHAFPFSARPDTEAFAMKPKVAERIAGERAARLIELAKKNKTSYINSFNGKIIDAVAESARNHSAVSKKQTVRAVTENFLHCEFECTENMPVPGEKIKLQIVGAHEERILKNSEYDVKAKLCR